MLNIYTKLILLLASIALLSGCKLTVISTSGGDTTSLSGTRDCTGGNNCDFEITSSDFSETFTANPKPGFEFVKWHDGAGFSCAGSTNPSCTVELPPEPWASAIVALFDIGYVMPLYKDVGFDPDGDGIRNELDEDDDNDGLLDEDDPCPTNPDLSCGGDIIAVNGKVWYQPDLFSGVSWEEVNGVCGEGVCDGVVNGYNLNGWAWADNADVQALMDHYASMNLEQDCPVVSSFLADGWRKTNTVFSLIGVVDLFGWTFTAPKGFGLAVDYLPISCIGSTGVDIDSTSLGFVGPGGAWFYYPPDP